MSNHPNQDQRDFFEHMAFGQYFLSNVTKGTGQFMGFKEDMKSSEEFLAKDAEGNYKIESINPAYVGFGFGLKYYSGRVLKLEELLNRLQLCLPTIEASVGKAVEIIKNGHTSDAELTPQEQLFLDTAEIVEGIKNDLPEALLHQKD